MKHDYFFTTLSVAIITALTVFATTALAETPESELCTFMYLQI